MRFFYGHYVIIMYDRLPKELIIHIYSFDNTFHSYYNLCINELHNTWEKSYHEYILWRSHCC